MTKQEKIQLVEELTEKIKEFPNIYVTDAGGMSVARVNELRRKCFEAGIEMRVVKNTLLKKALDNAEGNYEEMYAHFKQQSSVFFVGADNLSTPAKVIMDFRKKKEKPSLKAAYIDAAVFVGDASLSDLVSLKSKEELIGEIIGLLQSPIKNVLGALQSGGNTIAGLVKTLQERQG